MNNYADIVILAGENSGDQIAADLVSRLNAKGQNIRFSGMGGEKMAEQGVELLADFREIAIIGFADVIKKIFQLYRLKRTIKTHLLERKPSLLICVDFPGFNLSMAKIAKASGIPVLYYVAPKIWASRKGRVKAIKRDVDELILILPFESQIFKAYDIPSTYVGHPLIDKIEKEEANTPIQKVLLMPGSRDSEIKRLAPLMCEVGKKLHARYGITFCIPVANPTQTSLIERLFAELIAAGSAFCFPDDSGYRRTDYAIVASGTATLELAKRGIPMQVVYKVDALTYWIAKCIITVKNFSLCNLIAGKTIVPELIQKKATIDGVVKTFDHHFHHPEQHQQMKDDLARVIERLGKFNHELLLEKVAQFLPSTK